VGNRTDSGWDKSKRNCWKGNQGAQRIAKEPKEVDWIKDRDKKRL
jgi:hypothetical protein